MRRIVCARIRDTGEFDVIAADEVATTENRNQAPSMCPLAGSLIHMRGESHDNLFSDFVRLGILKWEHGHFDFTEMDHPCPYVQKQQTEDKPS